jgi:hypothetical protein
MMCTARQANSVGKIDTNEMGGVCSVYVGIDWRVQAFGGVPEGNRQLGSFN